VTGLLVGLVIVGAGALMNRKSTLPPQVLTGRVATQTAAVVGATSTPTPSATTTATSVTPPAATPEQTVAATLPADAYLKPVAKIASLLPKAVAGYKVGLVETTRDGAIVPLEPTNAGPLGKATIVVLTVFDKKTATAAQKYVDGFARAYRSDLAPVTIGTLRGRFGTDGSHLAAVTFCRGRFAFEVVLTATRGVPRDLKSVVVQAAEAFGSTKTAQ
jgi:hypothetical protein